MNRVECCQLTVKHSVVQCLCSHYRWENVLSTFNTQCSVASLAQLLGVELYTDQLPYHVRSRARIARRAYMFTSVNHIVVRGRAL